MKFIIALCALIAVANAASIKWTGLAQNNQWTSTVNWYPAQVPGPNDDVTIEKGNVQVTISTGVNSLTMGTSVDGIANLTLFQSFAVGSSMDVDVNGNLILNAGTASLTGTVTVKGHLYLQSGTLGGQITIASNGVADLSGGATKNLIGAGLTNQGSMLISGVVGFNQSSVLSNQGSIVASAFTQLSAGDDTQTLLDSSSGSFAYNGGSGSSNTLTISVTSSFKTISIQSGNVVSQGHVEIADTVLIPAGSTFVTQASANTTFGGSLTGAGALNVGGKVTTLNAVNLSAVTVTVGVVAFNGAVTADTLTIQAGNPTFSNTSNVGKLTITSGNVDFGGVLTAKTAIVDGGVLTGAGGFAATTSATFASQGINFGTTFTLDGSMTFSAKTLIAFNGGNFIVGSNGSVAVSSPVTLTGPPSSGSFTNNGKVTVGAALSATNINLLGQGAYSVSGTITTSTNTFSAGVVTIDGGSVSGGSTALNIGSVADSNSSGDVTIKIGSYSFNCPGQCKSVTSTASGSRYSFSAN